MITLTVDGQAVTVPAGTTLREAALAAGIHTPTLCWHPQLGAGSNCRICVVELAGSRTLVPACSRAAEPGMVVATDSPRVRLARRTVLELLYSQVNLDEAPEARAYAAWYGANPGRFDCTAALRSPGAYGGLPAHGRSSGGHGSGEHGSGEHGSGGHRPPLQVDRPPEQDNPFFVRDYARCILCQRCTAACGAGAQFTFAISVVGRGLGATIGTGGTGLLPDSPCVFCGNCVGACPTGALVALPAYAAAQAGLRRPEPVRWSPETGLVREEGEP